MGSDRFRSSALSASKADHTSRWPALLSRAVPQRPAEEFPRRRFRQLVPEFDFPGTLVGRDSLTAKGNDLPRLRLRATLLQRNKGLHRLPSIRIGHADHRRFPAGRVLIYRVLDFPRPDLETGRDDHVLLAIHQVKPALLIHDGDIARSKVAVVKSALGLAGLVPVTRAHEWTLQ